MKRLAGRNSPDTASDTPAAPAPAPAAPANAAKTSTPAQTAKAAPAPAAPVATAPAAAPPPPVAVQPAEAAAPAVQVVLPTGAAPISVVVKNEKPKEALSPADRRARSFTNLEKIGQALADYVAKYGKLPPQGLRPPGGRKTLSWRVAILPQLGYQELYDQFDVNEPWSGPRNKQLLAQIPPEFQSPERFDTKTNYLAVAGPQMLMESLEGLATSAVSDGLDNTVAILEVDDGRAVAWTDPSDWIPDLEYPADQLGRLRGDGIFSLMANGRLVSVPMGTWVKSWDQLCAPTDGQGAKIVLALKTPQLAPPPPPATPAAPRLADDEPQPTPEAKKGDTPPAPIGGNPPQVASDVKPGLDASALPPLPDVTGFGQQPTLGKRQIPDEAALAKSRELLKELYKEPRAARAIPDRLAFVKRLLADAGKVAPKSPDYYEILRVARDEAARLGDVPSALAACGLLEKEYRIDPLVTRLKVLEELNKAAKLVQPVDVAFQEASRLTREAFEADQYEVAIPAHALRVEFGRMIAAKEKPASGGLVNYRKAPKFGTPDTPQEKQLKAELARLTQEEELLETAQALHEAEKQALQALAANPADPDACETVGRYRCFVKSQWELGLPYLARAADIKLRFLASIDLQKTRTASETFSLGDEYWALATQLKQPQKRGLHLRAVYCYGTTAGESSVNLERLRAEKRVDEAVKLYGAKELERVLPKGAKIRGAVSES